jgi:hypothetical protein
MLLPCLTLRLPTQLALHIQGPIKVCRSRRFLRRNQVLQLHPLPRERPTLLRRYPPPANRTWRQTELLVTMFLGRRLCRQHLSRRKLLRRV